MDVPLALETEMDLESEIRRGVSRIMLSLSQRTCSRGQLESARAKVAEAAVILNPMESEK